MSATCQLFGASGAGIMMIDDNSVLSAVAAVDEPSRLLEVRQQECGQGPCVDALIFDRIISTVDLAIDERWPLLLPEIPDAGVRSVLGVPVHVSGVAVGSLNVYRNRPERWDDSEISALEAHASVIETLLRGALQARERDRLAEQLQHALDNRVVIERAVGAIMARKRVNAVVAFNELRTTARSSQRKVADLAAEVLSGIA
jgi:GAF domain-containing protein